MRAIIAVAVLALGVGVYFLAFDRTPEQAVAETPVADVDAPLEEPQDGHPIDELDDLVAGVGDDAPDRGDNHDLHPDRDTPDGADERLPDDGDAGGDLESENAADDMDRAEPADDRAEPQVDDTPERTAESGTRPAPAPRRAPRAERPAVVERKTVNEIRGNSVVPVTYVKVDGEWKFESFRLPPVGGQGAMTMSPGSQSRGSGTAGGGQVHNFDARSFQREVLRSPRPVAVVFHAPWCPACVGLDPKLSDIAKTVPQVKLGRLDIDEHDDLASRYDVESVPTTIVFENGKPVSRVVGGKVAQIRGMLTRFAP